MGAWRVPPAFYLEGRMEDRDTASTVRGEEPAYDESSNQGKMASSGNYYVDSPRRGLERRRTSLITELTMIDTALGLMTPEVEKAIQTQNILDRLNNIKRPR